ncbi:hypothetical protein Micbo1qcDRAFT_155964 [Microdochium bolleyi]|uniref:Uncharacterized protein n=1 Tax=Microdochium bolleyi TaxID=196109 RepID=A0A136JJ35_9PEZI|nr:hypothetical protein Micbo1qcDRAFT_155964 [Microdochium bolleyi]
MLLGHAHRRSIALDWQQQQQQQQQDIASAVYNNAALAMRAATTKIHMAGSVRQDSTAGMNDTLCGCTSTSMTTALIILLASIVGTALISSTATWLLLRRRYARRQSSKADKPDRDSPSPPPPQWQTWARGGSQQRTTAQPGGGSGDLQIGIAIDNSEGPTVPHTAAAAAAESSVARQASTRSDGGALPVRRRPEYASGLSSTFMFPKKDNGITTTIVSDAKRGKSRKLRSNRLTRSRSRSQSKARSRSPEPEHQHQQQHLEPATPRTSLQGVGDLGSTERLVSAAGDRTVETILLSSQDHDRPLATASSSLYSPTQPPEEDRSRSAQDAMRNRSHFSASPASARTDSPALSSNAPTIPKRSSMRVEILAAPSSFYNTGSGFPENSLQAGPSTPFASVIQPHPFEEQSQREVIPRPATPENKNNNNNDNNDEDHPRPSTSSTFGSPERSRRSRRARKGTLTMFPKIQDGPPPAIAAGLSMSSRANSVGARRHPQHQRKGSREEEEDEEDDAGRMRQDAAAIPLRRRSYSEITMAVPEDSIPRRSYGPNWPFKPA